jgi:hypothetical protein
MRIRPALAAGAVIVLVGAGTVSALLLRGGGGGSFRADAGARDLGAALFHDMNLIALSTMPACAELGPTSRWPSPVKGTVVEAAREFRGARVACMFEDGHGGATGGGFDDLGDPSVPSGVWDVYGRGGWRWGSCHARHDDCAEISILRRDPTHLYLTVVRRLDKRPGRLEIIVYLKR